MAKKIDLVRKSVLIGVGLAAYAQEYAEKLAKELTKKGKLSQAEGKKMVKKIYQEAKRNSEKVSQVAEAEVKKILRTAEAKGAKRMGISKTIKRRKKKR